MATTSLEISSPAAVAFGARRLSRLKLALSLTLIAFLSMEMICRFAIGLGDPPLYQADPEIEYLLQPSKTYSRFHNYLSVNRYGMRADNFPLHKSNPTELRVLVLGDSVMYGGVRIDQSEIATEILKRDLARKFGRPIVVGNGSAKGWGPPNELAYLKRFGTLDADVVILELSSHDYQDAHLSVQVAGVSADFPDKKPALALTDLLETYAIPRYLHSGTTPAGIEESFANADLSTMAIAECRASEREIFAFARNHGAKVILVQHLTRPELDTGYGRGYYANQEVAREENVPYVDDADELRVKLKSGVNPFFSGDPIHLSRSGQSLLSHALERGVDLALKND